jgi:hypothetical protein
MAVEQPHTICCKQTDFIAKPASVLLIAQLFIVPHRVFDREHTLKTWQSAQQVNKPNTFFVY